MTHVGTTRLLLLPGGGVHDPTMSECLISVTELLATGYHIIFRLTQDCGTDGFDKLAYPHYGGFITTSHQGTTSNLHDFIIMYFENNTCRLPSLRHCVVRPLLENTQSVQEIPADTFNNLPLKGDKECDSIFSEKEKRAHQIQDVLKLQVSMYREFGLVRLSFTNSGPRHRHYTITSYTCLHICRSYSGCTLQFRRFLPDWTLG
jgi:hypothetical protein